MNRFAVNVVGYIDDATGKYDARDIRDMINRKAVTECFPPIKVVEIFVSEVKGRDTIDPKKIQDKSIRIFRGRKKK